MERLILRGAQVFDANGPFSRGGLPEDAKLYVSRMHARRLTAQSRIKNVAQTVAHQV